MSVTFFKAALTGGTPGANLTAYAPVAGDVNATFTHPAGNDLVGNAAGTAYYVNNGSGLITLYLGDGGASLPSSGIGLTTFSASAFTSSAIAFEQFGFHFAYINSSNFFRVVVYYDGAGWAVYADNMVAGAGTNFATVAISSPVGTATTLSADYDPATANLKLYFNTAGGTRTQVGVTGGYTLTGVTVAGKPCGLYAVANTAHAESAGFQITGAEVDYVNSSSSFTLTGPSSGFTGNASGSFTFTPDALYTGTVTPAMAGLAGTWSPATLTWSGTSTAQAAAFTPSATGTGTANGTASPALTPPAGVSYTSLAPTLSALPALVPESVTTAVSLTGGGTHWLSSAPTFGSPGLAGVSYGTVTVLTDTAATVPVTAGATPGTITFTDSTTSATATATVSNLMSLYTSANLGTTGLAGTAGYTVYAADGTSFQARTTTGVTELGVARSYCATFNGSPGVTYYVVWDTGGGSPSYALDEVNTQVAPTGGTVTVGGYSAGEDPATLVLDAAASGHSTTGTIGAKLNAAGTSADPWATALPGSYSTGTAGNILASRGTSNYSGGPVASVTSPVTAGTVSDKTGYSLAPGGLDSITLTEPVAPSSGWNFRQWLRWLAMREVNASKTPTALTVKTMAGATSTTQAVTDDGAGTETLGVTS